ncbi:ABC transporter substrate-binding protein [Paenibacillus eucommiae]|uniref:Aldouronate transport system substrate-binding protein n=1 Tax=Paenibacillus eucommiae TaxID=1355755 RepID=A0ABS4J9F9_9BACL|nr:ABC transporter substrate-binding protein [Paenibacillus eucommiae]MBP1995354.1 putative aldouronate transport system substrate-binding protein [Paenibacillus eucommiae]
MLKKSVHFLILSLLAVSLLLSGCGTTPAENAGNNGTKETAEGSQLKPYEVAIAFWGNSQRDMELVEKEINKITKEKINATVKLNRIEPAAWTQQKILMLAGNEKADLIFTGEDQYISEVAQKQLLPLDDLLQSHGKDIIAAFEPEVLATSKINGKTYAVPSIRDFASYPTILMRTDMLEKYNIDVSGVKTLDDMDAVFQKVKENNPTFNLLGKATAAASIAYSHVITTVDPLGDMVGVLVDLDQLKVVNLYESDYYADMVKTLRRWYLAGYIPKDAATSKQTGRDYMQANVGFATVNKGKPGVISQTSQRVGVPITEVKFGPPKTDTVAITNAMFAIAANSKNPERAMMMLNLMYSDKDIVNLLAWGVEGEHYAKQPNNTINFPAGVESSQIGYNLRQGWMFGNQLLTYPWATDGPDIWKEMAEFNKSSKKSAALGFMYNPAPVKTELSAINNVIQQYSMGLETGTLDPDETLPKFIAALKSAGIDKVIAEKQKQLDEWAASSKK